MSTTLVAKCALEIWRASGERSRARLFALVEHFAKINGDLESMAHHWESAVSALRSWEAFR